MAKKFYLPAKEPEKAIWLSNLAAKLNEPGSSFPTRGEDYGLTAAEVVQVGRDAVMFAFCVSNQDNFKNEKKERTGYKNLVAEGPEGVVMGPYPTVTTAAPPSAVPQGVFKRVGQFVSRIKSSSPYDTTIGEDLGIIGDEVTFDPATFQPGLTVENTQQGRLLKFEKDVTDGVNVYSREKGVGSWILLGRDNFSPYLDSRAFAQPTELEYKVTAVIQDDEIGADSDIVSITSEVS